MKKVRKLLICTLIVGYAFLIAANAYSQSLRLHYSDDGTRINFANTYSTDCDVWPYISSMLVSLYVYEELDGVVICETSNYKDNPTLDYIVASWSTRSLASGRYVDEGTGIIEYNPPVQWQSSVDTDVRTFVHSNTRGATTYEMVEVTDDQVFLDRGMEMLKTFDVPCGNCIQILNSDLQDYVGVESYLKIRHGLSLSFGDTIPVYFLDENGTFLTAVKQDATGTNYKYEYIKNTDGEWEMIDVPEINQSSTVYSGDFLAECAAMDEVYAS